MQFRRKGNKIQVLAYRGYDRQKRRAVVKMLGSIDALSYEPTVGLIEKLTEKEKAELQEYMEKERQSEEKRIRQYVANIAASHIHTVADTIRAGDFVPDSKWAAEVWAAINELSKALRKAGYPKPKRRRKAADRPMQGQVGLPLGETPKSH